jgi:hypothetical protein
LSKAPKAKRRNVKWSQFDSKSYLSKEQVQEMEQLAGWGIPPDLDSRAMWLEVGEHPSDWVEAIHAFDVRGDKNELLRLLRSGCELPPSDCSHLADLIVRKKFVNAGDADDVRKLDEIQKVGDADADRAVGALMRARRDPGQTAARTKELLSANGTLSRSERARFADLIEYQELEKTKRGRPRTPSYEMSLKMALLLEAVSCIKRSVKTGKPLQEALEIARKLNEIPPPGDGNDILLDAYQGRHGGLRRSIFHAKK